MYTSVYIPFAHPPLGFYIAALLSDLFPVSELQILLWLPALINTISILAFYKFAEQILNSRMLAALAVLVYALSSRAFVWQGMGGGITPSLGIFFFLLLFLQGVQFFMGFSIKKPPRQIF